jgi:hypothetical protein
MSITQVTTPPYSIFTDNAAGGTIDGIKNSSAKIFWISADNTLNGSAVYVKIYGQASGNVTVGSTPPDLIMYVGGSSQETFHFPSGLIFPNGLSVATVTTPGTSGNTSPSSNVILTIAYL